MIETFTTYRNGETITLHRCRECSKRAAIIMGAPLEDNGFVPINVHPHLPGCPGHEESRGETVESMLRRRGGLRLPGWSHAPVLVAEMIARRADTELAPRPRFHPTKGQWRKRRKK